MKEGVPTYLVSDIIKSAIVYLLSHGASLVWITTTNIQLEHQITHWIERNEPPGDVNNNVHLTKWKCPSVLTYLVSDLIESTIVY